LNFGWRNCSSTNVMLFVCNALLCLSSLCLMLVSILLLKMLISLVNFPSNYSNSLVMLV